MGANANKGFIKAICGCLGTAWMVFVVGILVLILLLFLFDREPELLVACLAVLALLGLLWLARFLAAQVRKQCTKAMGDPKGQGSVGHVGAPSAKIPPSIYKRPDPLIYCQTYLMAQGLAVTWDNPDVHLELGGVPVPSHDLAPGTTYRVKAQVWNGSLEAPAVNLLVRFYYLSFGIGTQRNFIGDTFVNLPVKGAAGLPAIAEHDWTTPTTPGHYCLQVELVWADDANPANNLGQHNTDVKALNSPTATFQFSLRNESRFARTYQLELDSYTIPALLLCRRADENGRAPSVYARHRREAHPVPTDCAIQILPGATVALEPDEERVVTVKVVTERPVVDNQAVNVNAFVGSELAGGVTIYFHS